MNTIAHKSTIKAFSLALLLAATLPVAADQQRGAHGRGPQDGPDPMGPMLGQMQQMLHQLELSDQQREEIRDIMLSNRDNFAANRAASKANRETLHALVTAEELDSEALARAATAEGELASERVMMFGESAASVLAVLSPEQRAQVQAMELEPGSRGERPRRFGRGAKHDQDGAAGN